MLYINWVELQACLRMSPFKWDISQPSKMFIAREIKNNCCGIRFQDIGLLIISNS